MILIVTFETTLLDKKKVKILPNISLVYRSRFERSKIVQRQGFLRVIKDNRLTI